MTLVTISNWFDAWEDLQLVWLYDRKGRGDVLGVVRVARGISPFVRIALPGDTSTPSTPGRKPKFNSEQKEQIVVGTKEFPKKIKFVKEKISPRVGCGSE